MTCPAIDASAGWPYPLGEPHRWHANPVPENQSGWRGCSLDEDGNLRTLFIDEPAPTGRELAATCTRIGEAGHTMHGCTCGLRYVPRLEDFDSATAAWSREHQRHSAVIMFGQATGWIDVDISALLRVPPDPPDRYGVFSSFLRTSHFQLNVVGAPTEQAAARWRAAGIETYVYDPAADTSPARQMIARSPRLAVLAMRPDVPVVIHGAPRPAPTVANRAWQPRVMLPTPLWPTEADQVTDTDHGRGWRMVRDAGPILRRGDAYAITRQHEVVQLLRDPRVASPERVPVPDAPRLISADDLAVLQTVLSPRTSRRWVAQFRPRVAALLDALHPRGHCDGIADVAVPLVTELMAIMQNSPGDLASAITAADPSLPDEQTAGLTRLILQGTRGVSPVIGRLLLALAQLPALTRMLRDDLSRVPFFVEEVLRLDSDFPYVRRVVAEPIDIGSTHLPTGTTLYLLLAAINREAGGDGLRVVQRKPRRHWAFGVGSHRCHGSHLARGALQAIIEEWVARIADVRLNGTPQSGTGGVFSRLEAVPLSWTPPAP